MTDETVNASFDSLFDCMTSRPWARDSRSNLLLLTQE